MEIVKGKRQFGVGLNVGHSIVTNGILCVRGGDAVLPELLWDSLLILFKINVLRSI